MSQEKKYKIMIGAKLSEKQELHQYEESFRRWLGGELHAGRVTVRQATEELGLARGVVYSILKRYEPEVDLTLPVMTEAEKQQVKELQKHIKELEKKLEYADMKNKALNVLMDIAEKDFKISIRKKGGAKQ